MESGKSGGTWNGATENLKKRWVPLWVKISSDRDSGNAELVQLGGHWLPEDFIESEREGLFVTQGGHELKSNVPITGEITPEATTEMVSELMAPVVCSSATANQGKREKGLESSQDLPPYELFCMKLRSLLAERPRQQKELKGMFPELNLNKLRKWLSQAAEDRIIVRHDNPVAYELAERQLSMLGGN